MLRCAQYFCRFNRGWMESSVGASMLGNEGESIMSKNWSLFKVLMNARRAFRWFQSIPSILALYRLLKTDACAWVRRSLSLRPHTRTHVTNTGREKCYSFHIEQDLYGSVSFNRSLSIFHLSQMDHTSHSSTSTKCRVLVSLHGTDMYIHCNDAIALGNERSKET